MSDERVLLQPYSPAAVTLHFESPITHHASPEYSPLTTHHSSLNPSPRDDLVRVNGATPFPGYPPVAEPDE